MFTKQIEDSIMRDELSDILPCLDDWEEWGFIFKSDINWIGHCVVDGIKQDFGINHLEIDYKKSIKGEGIEKVGENEERYTIDGKMLEDFS